MMSRRKIFITFILTVFFCCMFTGIVLADTENRHVQGELLIKMTTGVSDSEIKRMCENHGAYVVKEIPRIKVKLLRLPEHAVASVKAALENNPNIEFVEYNFIAESFITPNDPHYPNQWHLPRIFAHDGWDICTGSTEPIIAIIDSGIDSDHPELAAKLVEGYNFISNNTNTDDVQGHGTATASIAAAITNNGIGVAGVAWGNNIMPLLVLGTDGRGTYADMIEAVIFAADNGAKVINMSLGGGDYSYSMQLAVNHAWDSGAIIIASAGNGGDIWPNYPASLRYVMSVSATDSFDNIASFSSFGNRVDITAPGVGIYTATRDNNYVSWNGTSLSCPMVSGLAGLIWSIDPNLTNAQVTALIEQSADDLGDIGHDQYFGHGIINVYNTLVKAELVLPYVDTTVPLVSVIVPEEGAAVSGGVEVTISAIDDVGIEIVEFYVDGVRYRTIIRTETSTGPYIFDWYTTNSSGETHVLSAIAYDTSRNIGYSESVTVYVGDIHNDYTPPVVRLTDPIDGSSFSKAVKIFATATDNTDVVKMKLFINGILTIDKATSTIRYRINGRKVSPGPYIIVVEAYDEVGNVGRETVTVYREE